MNHSKLLYLTIVACFLLFSCKNKKPVSDSVAYSEFIAAYTSGVIGISDDIRIDLVSNPKEAIPEELPADLIQIDPSVAGKTTLVDGRSILFHPEKPLQSGKNYHFTLNVGLIKTVPEKLRQFSFEVNTIVADFSVENFGIRSFRTNGELKTEISGSLTTSDLFPAEKVEQLVQAEQDGVVLPVRWDRTSRNAQQFVFNEIKRTKDAGKVKISWNGSPINADRKGKQEMEIPAIENFSLLNTKAISGISPYIELTFSDPLDQDQETEGLFMMQGIDFEVSIEDILSS